MARVRKLGDEYSESFEVPATSSYCPPRSQRRQTQSWGPRAACFGLGTRRSTGTGRQVTLPSAFSPHHPMGAGRGGDIASQKQVVCEPAGEGPGEDLGTCSPVFASGDLEFISPLGKGALGVDMFTVPRACVSPASWTLSGKIHASSSLRPSRSSRRGVHQGFLVCLSFWARRSRAEET